LQFYHLPEIVERGNMTSDPSSQEWPAAEQVKAAWRSKYRSCEDAGTDKELDWEAIVAATQALETVDEFVSPAVARSIQARINFIREIGRDYGLLSGFAVREELDIDPHTPMPRMFGICYRREGLYPAFLFEPSPDLPGKQRIKPVVAELAKLADEYEWDDEDVAFWLVSPTSWLASGGKPVDYMDDVEKVLGAFRDSAGVEW
jgi:hypothetical protein